MRRLSTEPGFTGRIMPSTGKRSFKAVALGVSTGGVDALKLLLGELPAGFPIPVLVVSHISPDAGNGLALLLDSLCAIRVKEADEGELIAGGTVYIAPPNYHLQLERDSRISLSVDPHVNFARPSVDVLLTTAADSLGKYLIGVVLTGAGSDGSKGLKQVEIHGGITIVQDPADAVADSMPRSALAMLKPDYLVGLKNLSGLLINLTKWSGGGINERPSYS